MASACNVADNYYGTEDTAGISYYEEASPSVFNNHPTGSGQQSTESSVVTTFTFMVPVEEGRHFEPVCGTSNRLHKSLTDLCSDSGVCLVTSVSTDGGVRVFIRGQKIWVFEAREKMVKLLQIQHEVHLDIPMEFHKHLFGTKGAVLEELENKTHTQIVIPKSNDNSSTIIVKGTEDNVEICRQQILRLVDELSKFERQVVEVDNRYHQLVCHKTNESLHNIVQRKHLRLDIPPLSIDKHEVLISGDREGVAQAANILLQTYNLMKSTYQELQIEIPKEKHRYIIGAKGAGIKDILDKTGVWVEINNSKWPDNNVCLLGPKDNLGSALTTVFVKSESVHSTNISAPGWLHRFIIGRNGSNIAEMSSNKPDICLSFEADLNQIIIEGSPDDVEDVSNEIYRKIFDLQSSLCLIELEVEPDMIKQIVGSGGSNIQKIRRESRCTIMFPRDPIKGIVNIVGKPDDVKSAQSMLLKTIEIIENTKTIDVIFRHEFIALLIGSWGKGLKYIKDKYPDVNITVTSQDSDCDIINLIGPRKDVDAVSVLLQKKHANLLESNYSEKITIPSKYHRIIVGREGITIRDLTRMTNTKFQIPAAKEARDDIIITGRKCDVQKAVQKVYNIYEKESNIIEVAIEIPKNLHMKLIGKGGSRINSFKDSCGLQVTVKFPTIDSDSNTVVIKGIKDDVFKAQIKLHDLVEEITSSNYEELFELTADEFEFLFMSPDLKFKKLREIHNVRISESEKGGLIISGQKENVTDVIQVLTAAKLEQGPIVTDSLSLPIEHVVYFQKSGESYRISNENHCKVTVPRNVKTSVNRNAIGVLNFKGPERKIKKVLSEIMQIVDDYENTITESVIVDERQLENLKNFCYSELSLISAKFKVHIDIPAYPGSSKCLSPYHIQNTNFPNGHFDTLDINTDVYSNVSAGFRPSNLSMSSFNHPKYKVVLTGPKDNILLAKEEIVKLFILDFEIDVPEEFFPLLIGSRGIKIKELRDKHNINVVIPSQRSQSKKVIVSGSSENAVAAKNEIMEFVEELKNLKKERLERYCKIIVNVPFEYHTQLIGVKGENISKIRNRHSVRITVPPLEDKSAEVIILGHKDDVEKAKLDLELFVQKLQHSIVEHIHIDARLHSRLIGSRGASLDELKKKYNVEVTFPLRGTAGPEAHIVKVKGSKDNVDLCADELVDRANEMLDERQSTQSLHIFSTENPRQCNQTSSGYQIRDAPWHQMRNPEAMQGCDNTDLVQVSSRPRSWNRQQPLPQ